MKYKVLLLSDDIRLHTGVSNISKQIILNTCEYFDYVQISCGSKQNIHEIIDVSDSISQNIKKDCSVRLYPTSGYGDAILLREVIRTESPDVIFHITDPHRWTWLYEMEHEIRKTIPIMYYHVWDNRPYPMFLKNIYNSCDWIGCISKLTLECVQNVVPEHKSIEYIPHGVDLNIFRKIDKNTIKKHKLGFLGKNYKFVLLSNNANITRKQLPLMIESFSKFYNKLTNDEKKDVVLLIHTNPHNKNGVNLNKLVDDCYADIPIKFSVDSVNENWLNYIYNLSSATINVSSNEGFGLTTLESLATGTPIIISDTGGLTNQYSEECGVIVKPKVKNLIGSQSTPYLYSDICDSDDIANAIHQLYSTIDNFADTDKYDKFITGNLFRAEQMCVSIKNAINSTINNFGKQTKQNYKLNKIS